MAQNDTDPGDLELPRHEHDRILEEQIIPRHFSGSRPAKADDRPKVIILAGQPGAGKGSLAEHAKKEFSAKGGAVAIDVDKLRDYHPAYEGAIKENDRTAAGRVQADAGAWADELRDEAMKRRHNAIIIDATLKSPDKAEDLCRKFKKEGYELEIRAMAVCREDSIQGIYGRYEGAKAKGENQQRWVDIEKVHDPAYEGVLESIRRIEESELADRICVYRRDPEKNDPELIYDSLDRTNGKQAPTAEGAIQEEREKDRTETERETYHKKNERIYEQIKRRGGLEEKENERFLKAYKKTEQYRAAQTADHGVANTARREPDVWSTLRDEPDRADWAALGVSPAEAPEKAQARIRS